MTNEEAIKILSQIRDALLASNSWLPSTDNPIKESFGMAINALTAQPEKRTEKHTETHACDLIDRQALCKYALNQKDKSVTPNDIMRFPSAQPEPCVDTIDALNESIKHFDDMAEECRRNANIERNDYMDMRDDAAEYRQLSIWLNELKWLRERFQLQPEPSQVARDIATIIENEKDMRVISKNEHLKTNHNAPFEEFISRKAAIDALHTWFRDGFDEDKWWNSTHVLAAIESLPSAQPDLSEYSDKLWKAAYERGRAEAQADIVRCKDCVYAADDDYHHCSYVTWWNGENDFCSHAERKTE